MKSQTICLVAWVALAAASNLGFAQDAPSADIAPQKGSLPQFKGNIGLGVDFIIHLGKSGGPQKPDFLIIRCGGCVKDAKPNVTIQADTPCEQPPCGKVNDEDVLAFEQGISILRKAFDAQRRRVPLEVEVPKGQ